MVKGVALEMLCRLLFTEGSNPSLSVPSPHSSTFLTKKKRKKQEITFLVFKKYYTYKSSILFFILIFLIAGICKILEKVDKE